MTTKLFVSSLPFSVSEDELRDTFSQVGMVKSAKVITDRETGRSRGFGFVEMSTSTEASAAITRLNQSKMGERTIIVAETKEREDRPRRNF